MTKRLCRMGLLTALALILFTVEAQIPAPIPVPGVKLGLSNIVTVYAMFALGPRDTLLILLCRIFLGSLFSGQMMTLLYSLSGGLLCYGSMLVLRRLLTRRQIWVCSVIGACFHNLGQMAAAIWVAGTWQLVYYLPVLLVCGMLSGLFTGLAAQALHDRLQRLPKNGSRS